MSEENTTTNTTTNTPTPTTPIVQPPAPPVQPPAPVPFKQPSGELRENVNRGETKSIDNRNNIDK